MSIKNNIEMVRDELTSEEKFFETSVITERFITKYKNMIIAGVVGIVVAVGGSIAYDINKESTVIAANEALVQLQENPSDAQVLERLQSLSPELHDVFVYSKAVIDKDNEVLTSLKGSQVLPLSDLVEYELAQNNKNVNDLTTYSLKQDAIYKDLAQVQAAILLLKDGDTEKAHSKLQTIADASPLAKVAQALLHYGVQ